MKWIIITIVMVMFLAGCDEVSNATLDNTEITIDGKTYQIELKEVAPETPTNEKPDASKLNAAQPGLPTPSIHTKYYITDKDGNFYAVRNELIPITNDIIRISKYEIKSPDSEWWIYEEGPKDLIKKDIKIEQVRL